MCCFASISFYPIFIFYRAVVFIIVRYLYTIVHVILRVFFVTYFQTVQKYKCLFIFEFVDSLLNESACCTLLYWSHVSVVKPTFGIVHAVPHRQFDENEISVRNVGVHHIRVHAVCRMYEDVSLIVQGPQDTNNNNYVSVLRSTRIAYHRIPRVRHIIGDCVYSEAARNIILRTIAPRLPSHI